MVNGGDVKELMNGGTSIVPNLDSIAEFRVLTNNFDAEYGNYSGGIVNVVTKVGRQPVARQRVRVSAQYRSGRPQFLFAGAQLLSARTSSAARSAGRSGRTRSSIFGDYQGTRTEQGIDTGLDSRADAGRPDRQSERSGELSNGYV